MCCFIQKAVLYLITDLSKLNALNLVYYDVQYIIHSRDKTELHNVFNTEITSKYSFTSNLNKIKHTQHYQNKYIL